MMPRPRQTDCQVEPAFPGLKYELVTFAMSEPDLVCHRLTNDCSIQEPHHIEECSRFNHQPYDGKDAAMHIENHYGPDTFINGASQADINKALTDPNTKRVTLHMPGDVFYRWEKGIRKKFKVNGVGTAERITENGDPWPVEKK